MRGITFWRQRKHICVIVAPSPLCCFEYILKSPHGLEIQQDSVGLSVLSVLTGKQHTAVKISAGFSTVLLYATLVRSSVDRWEVKHKVTPRDHLLWNYWSLINNTTSSFHMWIYDNLLVEEGTELHELNKPSEQWKWSKMPPSQKQNPPPMLWFMGSNSDWLSLLKLEQDDHQRMLSFQLYLDVDISSSWEGRGKPTFSLTCGISSWAQLPSCFVCFLAFYAPVCCCEDSSPPGAVLTL